MTVSGKLVLVVAKFNVPLTVNVAPPAIVMVELMSLAWPMFRLLNV